MRKRSAEEMNDHAKYLSTQSTASTDVYDADCRVLRKMNHDA